MPTVAIIGAGEIGGAAAQALATRDCASRILLIDAVAGLAAGKALDIQQSGAVDRFHTHLSGTDDLTAATTARVCVIADRAGQPTGQPSREWDGDDGLGMIRRLRQFAPESSVVFAGTAPLELMRRASTELGARRHQLVGSAPEALNSAIRAIAALEAHCSPAEIGLAVLGTPGGFVVAWSDASIAGYPLDRILSQAQIARLDARAARLWPPGPLALGAAAAAVTDGILRVSRRAFTAFAFMEDAFGARDPLAAVPVIMSLTGVGDVRMPALNTRERVRLETALGG